MGGLEDEREASGLKTMSNGDQRDRDDRGRWECQCCGNRNVQTTMPCIQSLCPKGNSIRHCSKVSPRSRSSFLKLVHTCKAKPSQSFGTKDVSARRIIGKLHCALLEAQALPNFPRGTSQLYRDFINEQNSKGSNQLYRNVINEQNCNSESIKQSIANSMSKSNLLVSHALRPREKKSEKSVIIHRHHNTHRSKTLWHLGTYSHLILL